MKIHTFIKSIMAIICAIILLYFGLLVEPLKLTEEQRTMLEPGDMTVRETLSPYISNGWVQITLASIVILAIAITTAQWYFGHHRTKRSK